MHYPLYLLVTGSLLFAKAAFSSEYLHKDPKACARTSFKCPSNQQPFYDGQGCGCQTRSEPLTSKRYYVNKDLKICATLRFKCDSGYTPLVDEQGCGCQRIECQAAESEKDPTKYQRIEVEDAGISFDIPQTWSALSEETTEWFPPQAKGTPFLGFKAEDTPPNWEPSQMLPKPPSTILGPYTIDLGWERGLLYFIYNSSKKFELHVIVPRLEGQLAYDFYAGAASLEQLHSIGAIHQRFIHSGELKAIKRYLKENPKECKGLKLDCNVNEQEFRDETGCGCMTLPQQEEVYDN